MITSGLHGGISNMREALLPERTRRLLTPLVGNNKKMSY